MSVAAAWQPQSHRNSHASQGPDVSTRGRYLELLRPRGVDGFPVATSDAVGVLLKLVLAAGLGDGLDEGAHGEELVDDDCEAEDVDLHLIHMSRMSTCSWCMHLTAPACIIQRPAPRGTCLPLSAASGGAAHSKTYTARRTHQGPTRYDAGLTSVIECQCHIAYKTCHH